ncbi:hypothetical protein [Bradyrhizobium sp. Tv2a-2]|uniref:hypothetical protein n=1 Tax=Bradyrhizobium sp. Tv2a-2 TaxID=113395 RepID=UPI0004220B84|nr:hypothetical protein [Bradyrhizobium sp. Tv2a-2]
MCIIFDIMIGFIGRTVARLILPLLSLGKISVQPLSAPMDAFNVFGYRHDSDGRIEIESTLAGFIGFLLCFAAFLMIGLLTHAAL